MRYFTSIALAVVLVAAASGLSYSSLPYGNESSQVAGRTLEGEALDCDLPQSLHMKNIGSKVDGAGMCVMSSIEMSALLCGRTEWTGLRDWCANEPGGGYPRKVERQLAEFARAKGIRGTLPFLQYEGPDVRPIVEAAAKSGRMAAVTYGWSPRYGRDIAHMVCLAKFSGKFAAILDNNYPGEDAYEWMPLDEAVRRITHQPRFMGQSKPVGWVFVWLYPPPPPSPRN